VRARNLKPSYFKNEDLAKCSFPARYLFAGLWCMADRDGKLENRPLRIKAEIFPFDSVDVPVLLAELEAANTDDPLILCYIVAKTGYIKIPKFQKHAAPHYSEKSSNFPDPQPFQYHSGDLTNRNALNPESPLLNPESPLLNPESPLLNPDSHDLVIMVPTATPKPTAKKFAKPGPEEVRSYAVSIGYHLNGEKFCDYYESKGWLIGKAPMKDWQAAVRTWKRNGYEGGTNGNARKIAGAAAPVPGKYDHLSD
jgi:hypothetical protein